MSVASVTAFPRRTPPTILVVEDDVLTRCLISDELRAQSFKVLEASSAEEALTVLDTVRIDLLFVDIYLPGPGNGLDVARIVHERRAPTRIILTSGNENISAPSNLGSLDMFVRKPYLNSHIVELVRRSLNWPEVPGV